MNHPSYLQTNRIRETNDETLVIGLHPAGILALPRSSVQIVNNHALLGEFVDRLPASDILLHAKAIL